MTVLFPGKLMAEAVRPPRRTLDGLPSPRSPEGADGLPYVAPPAKAAEVTVELPCTLAELARAWGCPTV
ncbi:hypothetical protein ACFWA5_09800 [Streptomyces mirabilis]|uniref:hypothetical protein n=1 Tax=Streptomyces mirabilis TaxID=68239 RepID=UPI00365531D0